MCNSCEALMINGLYCHETGCPNSDKDATGAYHAIECKWCGREFRPEEKGQKFCDDDCAQSYYF